MKNQFVVSGIKVRSADHSFLNFAHFCRACDIYVAKSRHSSPRFRHQLQRQRPQHQHLGSDCE